MRWTFAVESDLKGAEWVLSWPTISQLPRPMRITLTDLATGLSVDPDLSPEYRFIMTAPRRLFVLEVNARGVGAAHGRLTGVVRDLAGRPTRTRITVTGPGGYRHSVATDGRGRYALHGLEPGAYRVAAPAAAGLVIQTEVRVRDGEEARLNLRMERGGLPL